MQQQKDASGNLFNLIMQRYALKRDCALAAFLGLGAPAISKMRNGAPVTAETMIVVHDKTGMSINMIRAAIRGAA